MLPPGHIAAGYLTAEVLLKTLYPNLSNQQHIQLVLWGMFFSFAPDLDTFVSFAREHTWFVKNQSNNHRKFVSHAPLLWLLAGLLVYFFASQAYFKVFGLLIFLGSWSHFILDSIEYGIMWFWPFSKKIYAFRNRERDFKIQQTTFFGYWIEFVKVYTKTLTFYCEVIIILASVIYLITIH